MNERDRVVEDFLGRLLNEDLSDTAVKSFESAAKNDPQLIEELVKSLVMTELVSQSVEEERSAECFSEIVKSSLRMQKESSKDKFFVDSVKKKIALENKKKGSSGSYRKKSAKKISRQNKNTSAKVYLWLTPIIAALVIFGFVLTDKTRQQHESSSLLLVKGSLKVGAKLLQEGERIPQGKMLRVQDDDIQILFDDKSQVKIQKGSMFSFEDKVVRKLLLTNGRLDAEITSQKNKSIYFETPFSIAEIIGTRFTLKAEGWRDTLEVQEGRVHVTSLVTDDSFFVNGGEGTFVSRLGKITKNKKEVEVPAIRRFLLIERETGRILNEVKQNQEVRFKKYGKEVNLVAEVGRDVKVVIFVLNGKIVKEKVAARYIPHGNSFANIMPWNPTKGRKVIRLIPYHENGKLLREKTYTLNFKD